MEEFKALFQYPPKNAWNAVLVQLFCWCFRRFCVERLMEGSMNELWDSLFTLAIDFSPPQLQPHLDQWLTPEHTENVSNLTELDRVLRSIIVKLDTSISTDDLDTQDKISTFFDEEMSKVLEQWIGSVYAPFSLFPTPTESDTEINITKLNAIVYLLGRQPSLQRTVRKTFRSKRVVAPMRTQLRKTRRFKQNGEIQLLIKSDPRNNDARGTESQKHKSQGEKREGNEEHSSKEQRDSQGQDGSANKEGDSEHSQTQVHAEPLQQHPSTGDQKEDALKS